MKHLWLKKNYDLKSKRSIEVFHYLSLDLKAVIENMLLGYGSKSVVYNESIIKSVAESYISKIANSLELNDYNTRVDINHTAEGSGKIFDKCIITTFVNMKFIDNESQKIYRFNINLCNSYFKQNTETKLLDSYYNVTEL